MTTLVWPRTVLVPSTAGPPHAAPMNLSGGVSIGGIEQVVATSPGRWEMNYGGIVIRTAAQVLKWNEISGLLRGRLVPILIPLYDRQRAPRPAVVATLGADVAAGAVSMVIHVEDGGGDLVAGMHFSVGERLYRIVEVVDSEPGSPDGTDYTVNTYLPVREPIVAGSALEFADPYFRVKLAKDDAMKASLQLFKFASPSIDWVEDL